jgi:outer membrane receptor protein involved in Fe transport
LCVLPLAAQAQEQDQDQGQEAEQVVIVTGSRISRDANAASPVPVQTVDSDALTYSGSFNTVDVLNDVPALSFSTTSETSNQDGGISDGQNTLDLRGMGEERTLVLVDGRRHVSGVEGSQSVEIGSIPPALIERVEVLTGGASAVYGADAVTGVVNFILKKDFEGLEFDFKTGLSGEGDAEQFQLSGLYGKNFAEGRGNFTVGVNYYRDPGLTMSERSWATRNRIADDDSNPALRFQMGEISPATTPNFAAFYDFDSTGLYPYGLQIPSSDDFIAEYTDLFGEAPTLTAQELALIDRAAAAPPRAILPYHNFSISSKRGVIAPGDFSVFNGIDLDDNGVQDCLDSFTGYNSSLDGAASFGILGGCWVVDDNGQPRPVQDGLVAGDFNGFGGDGIENFFDEELLIPREERVAVNLTGRYQLSDTLAVFGEAKYVYAEVETGSPLNTFWDLLYGAPDNPFLPDALQQLAEDTGGLYITRDPTDIGPNRDTNERRTTRFVLGLEGKLGETWQYEVAANYGEFELQSIDRNYLISDRWFAAIDVISDPESGAPICRSDIDDTPPPTTVFDIPTWESGFFTFTPGDGQCRPANIWGGVGAISQDAIDFFTTTVYGKDTITQTVFSASLIGDSSTWFSLPAGPIGIALGAEWREETSKAEFDPLELGIIPEGAPFPAGTLVETVSENKTLGFEGSNKLNNANGSYDVTDFFTEVSVPLLKDTLLADELTLDGAFRYSDYSTIGGADTWKLGLVWAPVDDIRFRANVSQAVRAPNIFELFSPDQPAFFRPVDPCAQSEIDSLAESDPATAAIREANCRAAGIPEGFEDPLSARFAGVAGGNENLQEETADTRTIGVVLQPRFVENLVISVDYWDITVDDAIVAVSSQDIVDNCYDSPTFPNDYCSLFTRNTNPASAQFNGFNFLRQTQLNFGSIEASGIDFAFSYPFTLGSHRFSLSAQATRQKKLDYFFDPADATAVDPELGELFRPEWAGNASLAWTFKSLTLAWKTQYLGEQALRNVSIETYQTQYGESAIVDEVYLHDLTAQFALDETLTVFAGAQNITDEQPYITEFSWPTGPRGRFFYLGVNFKH